MRRMAKVLSVLAVMAVLVVACVRFPVRNIHPEAFRSTVAGRPVEHIVIVAIDGLMQETVLRYLSGTRPQRPGGLHDLLGARVEDGRLVLTNGIMVENAVSIFPSYTYPAWTSMLTGVFPGAHGISGNSFFVRDRRLARYYTDYHADALKVQLQRDFLGHDINPLVKTVYQHVDERGGQSIVVYNMVTEGAQRGNGERKPDFDTLWNYRRNRAHAVDENTLWEAVRSVQDFNRGVSGSLQLPTMLTIYFSGMDHAEHLARQDPEQARLHYLAHLDGLIAKFIGGDPAIMRHHFPTPSSEPVKKDPIAWRGLANEPVFERTLFVVVSDHGHRPIQWSRAISTDDLNLIFKDFARRTGRRIVFQNPVLFKDSLWSKIHAAFGLFEHDTVSRDTNVVVTLNGGALGVHVRPDGGPWTDRPDFARDIKPLIEHLLLTLHLNDLAPEAVLYYSGDRYVAVPYRYEHESVHLMEPVDVDQTDLRQYPMARRRIAGLIPQSKGDPMTAPDLILLPDRASGASYVNREDARVIEPLGVELRQHFYSDHGHLNAAESRVPVLFRIGGYRGGRPLPAICEASIVDIAPTILDALGLKPAFDQALAHYSDDMKGRSLLPSIERALSLPVAQATASDRCPVS